VVTTTPGDPYVASVTGNRGNGYFAVLFPFFGIVLSGAKRFRRDRAARAFFLFLLVTCGCGLIASGCASSKNFQKLGTPPGSYTVTITATSGSIQHSTTAQIVVQAQR